MKTNKTILTCAVLAILLALGCKSNPDDEPCGRSEKVAIPDSRAAYLFQPGTYWVYQDSATGALDSTYVTATVSDTLSYSSIGPGCDKYFRKEYAHRCDLESSRYGNLWSYYIHAAGISWGDPAQMINSYTSGYNHGMMIYFDAAVGLSRNINQWYDAGPPVTYFIGTVSPLTLGPVTFSETRQFSLESNGYDFLTNDAAFELFLGEPGVVRREIRDDSSRVMEAWNLVRWNVVL